MIRITKEGYLKKYRTVCTECGCEFEFDEKEVETKDYDWLMSDEYVKCPCCGNKIDSRDFCEVRN